MSAKDRVDSLAEEPLLDSQGPSSFGESYRAVAKHRRWLVLSITLNLVVSLVLLVVLLVSTSHGLLGHRTINQAENHPWSPIADGIDQSAQTVQWNGSIFKPNIYRGDASHAVDEAWRALGTHLSPFMISEADAAKVGVPADAIRASEQYGGGYVVLGEAFHQLHCLDIMRKSLYWNFEHYSSEGHRPFDRPYHHVKMHITHCMDIIRQRLMCTADTGVISQIWVQTPEAPSPTRHPMFSDTHKCRNYDKVKAWGEEHNLKQPFPEDFYAAPTKVYDEFP
ncbi:Hypothetical protein D9617_15g043250 [Elsinoe fawcettii]|nr:Hypothetical protein D9617_15g043250 [Elsinoe fawcettii]